MTTALQQSGDRHRRYIALRNIRAPSMLDAAAKLLSWCCFGRAFPSRPHTRPSDAGQPRASAAGAAFHCDFRRSLPASTVSSFYDDGIISEEGRDVAAQEVEGIDSDRDPGLRGRPEYGCDVRRSPAPVSNLATDSPAGLTDQPAEECPAVDCSSFGPVVEAVGPASASVIAGDCTVTQRGDCGLDETLQLGMDTRRMLERQFVASTTSRAAVSRGREWILRTAVAQASAGSIWLSSEPFATLFCKRFVRLLNAAILSLFAGALVFASLAAAAVIDFDDGAIGIRYRFRALELRAQGTDASAITSPRTSGIRWLGLTGWDGCLIRSTNSSSTGASVTITFDQPMRAAGWRFGLNRPGSAEEDPVLFVLESSMDRVGGVWATVGGSSPVLTWSGHLLPRADGRYPTGAEDRIEEQLSLLTPWTWWAQRLAYLAVTTVGFTVTLIAAVAGRPLIAQGGFQAIMVGLAVVDVTATVAFAATGQQAVAWVTAVTGSWETAASYLLIYRQSLMPYWSLTAGIAFIGVSFAHYAALSLDPYAEIFSLGIIRNHNVPQGVGALVLAGHAFISAWLSRRSAERLVLDDQATYEGLWAECCSRTPVAVRAALNA